MYKIKILFYNEQQQFQKRKGESKPCSFAWWANVLTITPQRVQQNKTSLLRALSEIFCKLTVNLTGKQVASQISQL